MNLILDFGNSFLKWAVFNQTQKIASKILPYNQYSDFEFIKSVFNLYSIKGMICSSVRNNFDEYVKFSKKNNSIFTLWLSNSTKIPLKNLYKTPQTLGVDRIAAAVGASILFPNQNCLVIDAGTAITYEFISEKNEYLGGNISPGLTMRFNALNHFTQKLPLCKSQTNFKIIGTTSNEAIIAGVQNGILFEINGYIKKMQEKFRNLKIILTGGDTLFFENNLKKTIFAQPDLVLIGLNGILQHNLMINEN